MTCQCCHHAINARTLSPRHVYTLPLYVELLPGIVAKMGTEQRAVCAGCVARIERTHQARRNARRSFVWGVA